MTKKVPVNIVYSSKGAKQAARETRDVQSGLEGLGKAALTAGAGMAAIKLAEKAIEMVEYGAAIEETSRRLDIMTQGGADEYIDSITKATAGMVSEQDAAAVALKLVGLQLVDNEEQAAKLSSRVAVLGQTFKGLDAAAAADEFALLMSNMSIPRLDSFGLSAANVRARIKELQEQTAGLSKEAAFQQAVMEELDKAYERVGGTSTGLSSDMQMLDADIENLKGHFAELAATVGGPVVRSTVIYTESLKGLNAAIEDVEAAQIANESTSEDYIETLTMMQGVSQKQARAFVEQAQASAKAEQRLDEQRKVTEYYNQMAYQAADATEEMTGEILTEEEALKRAEEARQKYIDSLRDSFDEQKAVANITADLVGQFDTLGQTFYSIVPINNEAAQAAERYGENVEDLHDTAAQLQQDIQYLGDEEGALQAQLDETNAVIAQQQGAMDAAAASAGTLRNVYTITELTQEQMNLLGESWLDVLAATGNELLLTGNAYDQYRMQMGLATEEQIRLEGATRSITEAMDQGRLNVQQAGDVYAAAMTGQVENVEEAIAAQEAYNAQLMVMGGFSAEDLGLAETFEEAAEPTAVIAEQFGAMADSVQQLEEFAPAAFEALTESAPTAVEALLPFKETLLVSANQIKGMKEAAPGWAEAINTAGAALAQEGSGFSLAASELAGMQQDWRYLQNNPRLELEAIVSVTTLGGVAGAAGGANFRTRGPQMLLVGEAGPEHVQVTPLSGGSKPPPITSASPIIPMAGGGSGYAGMGGGVTYQISGGIHLHGVQNVRELARELERELGHQGKEFAQMRMTA